MCDNIIRVKRTTGTEIHFVALLSEEVPVPVRSRKKKATGSESIENMKAFANAFQKKPKDSDISRSFWINGKKYDTLPKNRISLMSPEEEEELN